MMFDTSWTKDEKRAWFVEKGAAFGAASQEYRAAARELYSDAASASLRDEFTIEEVTEMSKESSRLLGRGDKDDERLDKLAEYMKQERALLAQAEQATLN